MLIADETRRRCTFVPVGLLVLGLGIGAFAAGLVAMGSLKEAGIFGAVALSILGWFALGIRLARREGEELAIRSLTRKQLLRAKGYAVEIQQGGGHRSPHFDVQLRHAGQETLRLARLEALGVGRAPKLARRIAQVLDVPVHEPSVGKLEAQLAVAAEQRRAGWRWMAGIVAVGVVVSLVMPLVADRTMATLIVRCPGGQIREGAMTMLDGLEMTADPGVHTYELHPAEGPAWTQRVELVVGQTTVLDCSARPSPAPATHTRERQ